MENYEEKYKRALERARQVHTTNVDENKKSTEYIFPELKESEDEKIRKELISFIKEGKPYYCPGSVRRQEWIDWLEKQGHDGKKWIYEDVYLKEKEQLIQDGIDEVLENPQKYSLEKQGEQMPWSEENSCYYDDICEILINLINSPKSNVNKDVVQKDLDWLVNVYRREESQLKLAWSEEDEKFTHGLIRGLTAKRDIHGHTTFSSDCIDITETIHWLKSLKSKSNWRPTKDQLEAFEHFVRNIGESGYASPYDEKTKNLQSLLYNLKNL